MAEEKEEFVEETTPSTAIESMDPSNEETVAPAQSEAPVEVVEEPATEPTLEDASAPVEASVTETPAVPEKPKKTFPKDGPYDEHGRPYVYQWKYDSTREEIKQKVNAERSTGLKTFIIVMSMTFALLLVITVCLMILQITGVIGGTVSSSEGGGGIDAVAVAEKCNPSIVFVQAVVSGGYSNGSGFIIRSDGYIITNYHVVKGCTSVSVRTYGGKTYDAKFMGGSELDDVAVLKVDGHILPAISIGDSDQTKQGESIVAIGCPNGIQYGWTLTRGVVSYNGREVKSYNSDGTMSKKMKYIQFDASANTGNSGGPIINNRGEVIGIVTMKLYQGTYDDFNFAVPINTAMAIAKSIMQNGSDELVTGTAESRPVLGITAYQSGFLEGHKYYFYDLKDSDVKGVVDTRKTDDDRYYYYKQELDEGETGELETASGIEVYRIYVDESELYTATSSGVMVLTINDDSDAKGKLEVGDIIISVNGVPTSSVSMVASILNDLHAGDEVLLYVDHNGVRSDVKIKLGSMATTETN